MLGLQPQISAVADYWVQAIQAAGGRVTITSTLRSYADQARLYAARGSNPFPVAAPGTSKHELGEAFDAVVTPREWQAAAGAFWEALGGRWGGRFSHPDPVHFESP